MRIHPAIIAQAAATTACLLPGRFFLGVGGGQRQRRAGGGAVVCGPNPENHLDGIRRYVEAGYDHVYIHQVGPDQEGFFRFYGRVAAHGGGDAPSGHRRSAVTPWGGGITREKGQPSRRPTMAPLCSRSREAS
ncbi:MAG: LLM class flavin-dependent oxidoreductase [Chloroflexi bacterium]|nr:MAG: LLM class flavin-dependent oxidoreductase [Chloroflexota bacterium]